MQKSEILLALPRESAAYEQARRADRFGLPTPQATPVPAAVVLPPYLVQGSLRLPGPIEWPYLLTRLPAFFALTDAVIRFDGGNSEAAPAILLNRDAVAAFGPQEQG